MQQYRWVCRCCHRTPVTNPDTPHLHLPPSPGGRGAAVVAPFEHTPHALTRARIEPLQVGVALLTGKTDAPAAVQGDGAEPMSYEKEVVTTEGGLEAEVKVGGGVGICQVARARARLWSAWAAQLCAASRPPLLEESTHTRIIRQSGASAGAPALPPCHPAAQLHSHPAGRLDARHQPCRASSQQHRGYSRV